MTYAAFEATKSRPVLNDLSVNLFVRKPHYERCRLSLKESRLTTFRL